ncbi:MAG: lysophospholipid acyltransferase family protein [Nitrospirae bacterium]|nr:lysophospholipid acyltransferase family protein [Candidatus Manganitrophaceae bacterium]
MRQKLEYLLARILILFLQRLPFRIAVAFGAALGRLFYLADRRHRWITFEALKTAIGTERDERELWRIARGVFENLGRSVTEFVWIQGRPADLLMQRTTFEGMEHYTAAAEGKKGVLLLTAHFGNWEWMATAAAVLGMKLSVVARPLDNPYLNEMINGWRERYGNRVLNKRTSAAEIMRRLRAGETVGVLLDQNTALSEAVFVDYFGRPAATHKGLAIMALRTGVPLLPAFIVREGNRHRVIVEKPLEIPRTGNLERDIREATALFTRTIESYVRRYPDQWLWVHRRWKTQPK